MSFFRLSLDPMSFDRISFDPMSFEPRYFDPGSFDPKSFGPMLVNQLGLLFLKVIGLILPSMTWLKKTVNFI